MANPAEHPAESEATFDPANKYQAIVERHMDALADELATHGLEARSLLIGVRLTEPFMDDGNDSISGYRMEVEEGEELGPVIVDHLRRMTRAVLRTMMGMRA